MDRALSLDEDEPDELEVKKMILVSQVVGVVSLLVTGVFALTVELFWPDFYNHPNLAWHVDAATLALFWPLFAYAAFMAVISSLDIISDGDDEKIFVLSVFTSVLAGVWEEIGYRWIFVCLAMVGLTFSNWFLGTVAGGVFAVVAVLCGIAFFASGYTEDEKWRFAGGTAFAAVGIFWLWAIWEGFNNPVFWMYDTIVIPVVNLVTLGYFEHIIKNPALPPLFVFGMIAANAKFRDGHKYQGAPGMLNAWIIGFIMMHATIIYGIGTAVVLHAIYNLEFAAIRYSARKLIG